MKYWLLKRARIRIGCNFQRSTNNLYLGGRKINNIIRAIGFGLLISIVILGPIYKIFGLAYEFWIALAVCVLLTCWAFMLYRRFVTIIACPKCRYRMTYQLVAKTGKCPKCSTVIQILYVGSGKSNKS